MLQQLATQQKKPAKKSRKAPESVIYVQQPAAPIPPPVITQPVAKPNNEMANAMKQQILKF